MKISIAKALKMKNRLGGRIKKVQGKIKKFNSIDSRKSNPVDVMAEMDELAKMNFLIVNLKTAIYKSNSYICEDLILMSELRQHIAFLSSIDTEEGPVETYSDVERENVCIINYGEVEALIESSECQVRELQDKMDHHNATTMIEVHDDIKGYE